MAFVRGVIYDQLVRRLLHKLLPRRPVWSPAARSLVTSSSQHRICSAPIPEFEDEPGIKSYDDLYRFSLENPDTFWSRLAKSRLRWYQEFDKVSDCDVNKGKIAWFLNGKLNVSVNCVDRHKEADPDRVALIWERDGPGQQQYLTYKQLYELMNQIANSLKSHGVHRGDRVVIYMPVSHLAVATMLACARIGAIHSVVFAGFSAEALASRIRDAGAHTIVTTDQAVRGGKVIQLKKTVDEAVSKCPDIVKRVFVAKRTGAEVPMGEKDFCLEKEISKQSTECSPEVMNSEDILFLLYTSGSTGKPKGIVHTQAGYLLYAACTHQLVFDYQPGDVFGCVADIGWITGHSYVVYGPLCNGATTVLFESTPLYPNPGRYWETIQRLRINQFYGAPTALRLLLRHGDGWVKQYDRSSLKTLGCVGEPLNTEAWEWYHDVVGEGRCPVVDTWWQTETGGICITPRPSAARAEIKPGMPMRPFLGIEPVICNDKGEIETDDDVSGSLCIKQPWPGIARTIYGDHQRFFDTYFKRFPGLYFSGDGTHRHTDGYYQITGRMDDVINISGHRLGTAEVEDVMDEHTDVAETAVVGYPHELKGEGIYAFITLKENVAKSTTDIITDLRVLVKNNIASYAIPDIIQVTKGLPKTRSGKIMRRILKKIVQGKSDELGDISTLADPTVVAGIIKKHDELKQNKS
ncbi:hypothetical protein LSH36_1111g01020 [Paralvinella palmiformis]|uniref:Acetyl-coenzyme A synthetase n=1 Tax=Paralvinella palmiformis TaxID=53620 RepID=A0AAD9IUT7_9ANNE|nr:hypothetical protein LSH36_1111g01020 [Paralvinella palmiformis]